LIQKLIDNGGTPPPPPGHPGPPVPLGPAAAPLAQ